MASRMPYPYTSEDAKWWVCTGSKEQGLNFAIDFEGTCIGVIGVRFGENEYQYSAEIGYWIDKLGSQVEQEKTNQKRGKRLPKHHIVSMNQLKENGWKVADLANRFDVSNRTIQRHIRKH